MKPVLDTTSNGQVFDETKQLAPFTGKTIGEITIDRKQVFDPGGKWLERTANKTHMLTRERVIRRDLLFKSGEELDPQLIVRTKQLLRSRDYIADIEIDVKPDSIDSTRVNLRITTRDSWTISADGALHSEGRTMVGLSDANILGTGNSLKVMTNFSRNDFSYGGNMVEYEIPNVLGTFFTADCAAGRDFYNSTLDLRLQKEFLRPTDYEAGVTYSNIKEKILPPAIEEYGVKKGAQGRLERQIEKEIDRTFDEIHDDYAQQEKLARTRLENKRREAETEEEVQQAESEYQTDMSAAMQTLMATVQTAVEKTITEKPQEVVERLERHKEEQEKRSVEEEVRAHLRGFSRTIPSFIMAYGNESLTLANFDKYTESDVFLEVTGITEDDFRFLRDGGDYVDPETGETQHFEGHLFDEVVFNDSIEEFWKKKQQLANYFDESQDEDIFDYIPPQKTNQIFTPKWVVSMMVDQLEENNPGCFDDPDKTFADLYMKSGLYITEIVKRLYRSEGLKTAFPDGKERIRHILQKQVYGMAPTRIIYLIATNYILGFDGELQKSDHNFVQADAAEAESLSGLPPGNLTGLSWQGVI